VRNRILSLLSLTAFALSGCAGSGAVGTAVTPASVARYQAIAGGLLSIAGTEAALGGASPETVAAVRADAALAQATIAQLAPGMAAVTALPLLARVKLAADRVLAVAAWLPLPPAAQQTVLALQVLLPFAEASVAAPAEPVVLPPAALVLPPTQAQAVLLAAPAPPAEALAR